MVLLAAAKTALQQVKFARITLVSVQVQESSVEVYAVLLSGGAVVVRVGIYSTTHKTVAFHVLSALLTRNVAMARVRIHRTTIHRTVVAVEKSVILVKYAVAANARTYKPIHNTAALVGKIAVHRICSAIKEHANANGRPGLMVVVPWIPRFQ